jgi:hypothetical protein
MRRSERIVTYALAILGIALAIWLGCMLAGCGSLTLRPVQRDHALRMAQVKEMLGTDDAHLSVMVVNSQAECDALDTKVTAFTASSVVAGVLGGGSGVTSIFTESTPRYVVGGVGVGLSALTALTAYLTVRYSQLFARRCTVNTGGF